MSTNSKRKDSNDLDDLASDVKEGPLESNSPSPPSSPPQQEDFNILIQKKSENQQVAASASANTAPVEKCIPSKVVLTWKQLSIRKRKSSIWARKPSSQNGWPDKSCILEDVCGLVEPGEILAIMGPSGSGKTSLLNALSFSTKSPLNAHGRVMINGCDADSTRMAMIARYVQQDDLFFGTLTVREHLTFHAMLRLDKRISREDKLKRVEKVLKEFNLESRSNVKIGIPGRIKGISGGEKRRLAFASEILTDPPLLFCDEPTSGLDSYMAKSVVYYLQRMAQNGKTIVCTIHQPSSEIFNMFDKICLLSQSKCAYFGSRENALTFFSQNLKKECPPFTNPADFYMDVLGLNVNEIERSKSEINGYCKEFARSEYNAELNERIDSVKAEYFSAPSSYTPYKSSWFDQLHFLLDRSYKNYIRNHKVVLNDVFMVLMTALLGGLIYFKTGLRENGSCSIEQPGIPNISIALFYMITTCVLFSLLAAVMTFPLELSIYNREHNAFVYRSDTYYLSKLINEVPIYIILPSIHATIIYFLVDFNCHIPNYLVFLLTDILISNAAYSLGHILSVVSSDVNFAVSLSAPTIAIQMLFSGFFLNKTLRTPKFLTYIKYTSVFNYAFDLLMLNQWENMPPTITCEEDIELLCMTKSRDILKDAKISSGHELFNVGMLIVLAVGFRIIAFAILWARGHRRSIRTGKTLTKFQSNVSEA